MHTASGELVDFGAYCVKRLCENDDISRAYTCKIGTHGAGVYINTCIYVAHYTLCVFCVYLSFYNY